MNRKFLVLALLVWIVGFLLGYWVKGRFTTVFLPPTTSTVSTDDSVPTVISERISSAMAAASAAGSSWGSESPAGWCCIARGATCAASPSALECIGGGALFFDGQHDRCDRICSSLQ